MRSGLDKRRVAAMFEKAAVRYDSYAFLQREIADRALDRLGLVAMEPLSILDAGSGTGYCARALASCYRKAKILQCDIAWAMLKEARAKEGKFFSRQRFVCCDIERVALKDAVFDLVFSSLSLQWCRELNRAFSETHRILKPDGLFLFTTLGPDTLKELRLAWTEVSDTPHVNQFFDMHDMGDALVANGFSHPVMEAEYITVNYDDVMSLMRDLKGLGASNAAPDRSRGLLGKKNLRAFKDAYEVNRADGKLPATYEVIYGHAWARGNVSDRNKVSAEYPLRRRVQT